MLTACGHKAQQPAIDLVDASVPVVDAAPDVQSGPITITNGNWSFSLPDNTWVKEGDAENMLAFSHENLRTKIAFTSEKYSGTYPAYVLYALRGLKDNYSTINFAKQITLNNNKFVLIQSYKYGMTVWVWASLVNTDGVGLSCGGPYGDVVVESLCKQLAETLKHN
jgi:hypothetical protein